MEEQPFIRSIALVAGGTEVTLPTTIGLTYTVEFTDELRAAYTLADYTLGSVDVTDKDVIRYAVTLKLKDKKGKLTDREVVFLVALKSPIVVARDPYS